LTGLTQPHHRFLIEQILGHIDYLEEAIAKVQREIEQRLEENAEEVELLQTIPSMKANAAAIIIAEIGTDMSRFLLTPSISLHGREFVQATSRVQANGSRIVSPTAIPICEPF